jgi:trans-aconitate 2-methyltransferase
MAEWDAELYLKFAGERTQPSIDLIQRIKLTAPRTIVDLGCGPGNSTEALQRRWPEAKITGVDSSPRMIEAARKAYPDGFWELADAATWTAHEPVDLVFSNAMFQWLPDHVTLCRHLFGQLAPGGALAVQMPAHHDSPVHREMLEVSKDAAWRDRMEDARAALTRKPPSLYYDTLAPEAAQLDVWETIYYHVLAGPEAILEWFRGTGLRPFLESLNSNPERLRFEQLLLERYNASYPRQPDGQVLFPFRRLFFIAHRRPPA